MCIDKSCEQLNSKNSQLAKWFCSTVPYIGVVFPYFEIAIIFLFLDELEENANISVVLKYE